jgi:peptide-methionine (S)-S-oxide reductase
METKNLNRVKIATFGMGCFWCSEAIFQKLKGVIKVVPGYSGGDVPNPKYEDVCRGDTGHTEVVQIEFDSTQISYLDLLNVFFKTHDPTALNRQGNDVGFQYRSVIFYHDDEQKNLALNYKQKLEEEKIFESPIVTAIEPFKNFYHAEDYHQNYYNLNNNKPYCQFVIEPKIEKFEKDFKEKISK